MPAAGLSEVLARALAAHAAAEEEHVCGWLYGAYDSDGAPVPLGAVRCLNYARRGARAQSAACAVPDAGAEGRALAALVPSGLSIVGYYSSATLDAAPSAAAVGACPAALARPPLPACAERTHPWPSAGQPQLAVVAALGGGSGPAAAEMFVQQTADAAAPAPGAWIPLADAQLDARAARWRDASASVRCTLRLPLQIQPRAGAAGAGAAWSAGLAAALDEADALLRSTSVHAHVLGAPQLGIHPLAAVASDAPAGARSAPPTVREAVQASGSAGQQAAGAPPMLALELMWEQTTSSAPPVRPPVLVSAEAGAAGPATQPPAPVSVPVALDVLHVVPASEAVADAARGVQAALCAQLRRLGALVGADTPSGTRARACVFEPCAAMQPPTAMHFQAEYVLRPSDDSAEASALEARRALHARLGLPTDRPLVRTCNALPPPGERRALCATRLVNIHEQCPPSGLKGGMLAAVRGQYEYYHYMQDNFDDKGWGCAYRSLMTIVSWYRMQNYTTVEVPAHPVIQARLVNECAQPASLINSKRWIGALDVSMFLEIALGVTCRIENFSSGAELASKGRQLLHHFETQGTPVMMGGGELAYTLLGVHFDDKSGDIRFLILDPHYTGRDDQGEIVSKKWCGWHTADKFVKTAFYNLCFPLCPDCI